MRKIIKNYCGNSCGKIPAVDSSVFATGSSKPNGHNVTVWPRVSRSDDTTDTGILYARVRARQKRPMCC